MSAVNYEIEFDSENSSGGSGGGTSTTPRTSTGSSTGSTSRSSGSGSGGTTSSDGTTIRSTSGNTVVSGRTGGTTSRSQSTQFYFKDVVDGKITMNPGETLELHLYVASGDRPEITFESSNPSVAVISKTGIVVGKVTARAIGVTEIKASYTSSRGSYFEAFVTVVVGPVGVDINSIPDDHKIWMVIGEKRTITIEKNPSSTSVDSSDTNIATFTKTYVNSAQLVAKSPGVCIVRYILDRKDVVDQYYVIVTHGDGTNYLDIITFENSRTWENLSLGSVFVVGCDKRETSGSQGSLFRNSILRPESWRNLVNRSYKELRVSKLGQDISIKVTPPRYLEDEESETAWIEQLSSAFPVSEEEATMEIFHNIVGIGTYKFNVQSNCPVRFRTSSDKISLGPWSEEPRSEYVLSDFGNSKTLSIHVRELPLEPEVIDFSYECTDGRDHHDLKLKLWPCLPGLVDIRGPYIYIIPGESTSYNQRIEVKSYGQLAFSGVEYPRERDTRVKSEEQLAGMWTTNLSEADRSISGLKVGISSEPPYALPRDESSGVLKYYITLKSVTGYTTDLDLLPTAPVARIRFDVLNESESPNVFSPINQVVKDHVYYYIYVLPEVPLRNADTYIGIDSILRDFENYGIKYSVFERLVTNDLKATWPGTDVRFVDVSGMSEFFNVRYPSGAETGYRNNHGVQLEVAWADTDYAWNHIDNGRELGTIVIRWYYNKDHILKYYGLFNDYYLSPDDPKGIGDPPYHPNDQFYIQTVHFIKNEYSRRIVNFTDLPGHYSAFGTYDPVTLNPKYDVIRTDVTFGKTNLIGGNAGYYQYFFRMEEVYDAPIKYKCELSSENDSSLWLTIEPRGNNVSFTLNNWEDLIPYYSVARGAIKIVMEGRERSGHGSKEFSTVLDTYSFTQDGLEDCIVFKDKIYLGRSEITLPDMDCSATEINLGASGGIRSYRISDIVGYQGNLGNAAVLSNGINICVWKDEETTPILNETVTSFNKPVPISDNDSDSEIIYTIEVTHKELPSTASTGGVGVESRLIIKVKQKSKSSDVYVNKTRMPYVFSFGALEDPFVFYTTIPKNKIWIEEVTKQDPLGIWSINPDFERPRIESYIEEDPDPDAPPGFRCYRCFMSFSPNSSYVVPSGSEYGENTTRRIRIRHVDIEGGDIYEFKQGYYSIYPTLIYRAAEGDSELTIITEKDCRRSDPIPEKSIVYNKDEGFWQIGTKANPIDLPPLRNVGSTEDLNKVWVSIMAIQHEVSDGDTVTWVSTNDLLKLGLLEIETNTRQLISDTIDTLAMSTLSEKDWFNTIQTDLVVHSTDKTTERTLRILGAIPEEDNGEDIEFPALETIYTASGAGFYERRVIIQENVELSLGILTDKKKQKPLYEGSKVVTVNSKIQIWYRKIGEDIKDE